MRRLLVALALVVVVLLLLPESSTTMAQSASGPIYLVEVDGVVTSVTVGYLQRALHVAEAADAQALIIELRNRGGVLEAIRTFAIEINQARVPVVVYVAPSGTQSGAAGAMFLSAAHISAMAPNTSFGDPTPLTQIDATLSEQTRDLVLASVAQQISDWNSARGRNTAWVERAVREGAVLTNQQAISLSPPAIDLVASQRSELLLLLNNRTVTLADGSSVMLSTLQSTPVSVAPTLWEQFRLTLADPTIAFVLLIIGALAIYLEFSVPGTTVFAGIGIVLIILAAMGLFVLPIRWWSLLILLVALGLIGVEFFSSTHGVFAVCGIALVVVSALTLIDPAQAPETMVALWVIVLMVLFLIAATAIGVWLVLRSHAQPIVTGQEALIGQLAQVRQRLDPQGMVFVEGALWQAVSEDGVVEVGDWVRVRAVHELQLIVGQLSTEEEVSPR